MPGESFIKDLVLGTPPGTENISSGDDHITGIKGAVVGSFDGFEGVTATPKTVTKTEDQINDLAEKSLDTENITGDWEFSGEVKFTGGQFGVELENGTVIRGRNIADNADIPLVQVGTAGPTGDKAIFGATNADSVYEGDVHEFNGDVTIVASTTGSNAPGDLTVAGELNVSSFTAQDLSGTVTLSAPGQFRVPSTFRSGTIRESQGVDVHDLTGNLLGFIRLYRHNT